MTDVYKYISAKIRELRDDVKMSQEDLAKKLEIAPNTLSRWETATYKPTAEDLDKLARFFEVPISIFFSEQEDTTAQRVSALTSALGGLGEDDFQEVINYAKFRKARLRLQAPAVKKKRKRA